MKIDLTLVVDPHDEDSSHSSGITSAAFDRLDEALAEAGFEIESGPTPVEEKR